MNKYVQYLTYLDICLLNRIQDIMVNNKWVIHLCKYSLKELRRRQNIVEKQIQIAFNSKPKKIKALKNLQMMQDSLIESVYLKSFNSIKEKYE